MYILNNQKMMDALAAFKATNFDTPKQGDDFFGRTGPGSPIDAADRPFERFSDYEELLFLLMKTDPTKYRRMHKGTAFGFMAWLAFDLRNFEKGLFYLDAAISEDVRKANPPASWVNNPGPRVLVLDVDPQNLWFKRTVSNIERVLQQELTRFNKNSNRPQLDITAWRGFVRKLIADPTERTIISALYVFLLEYEDRLNELKLREGSTGGSNQPFTVHLFTGGLLFESLLKRCYPRNGQNQLNRTLGGVLSTPAFLADFGLAAAPSTSAGSLTEIYDAIQGSASIETAFSTAAKLRNTTGHNLVWDDIFSTPGRYVELFEQVMNALLHVVSLKLL